MNLSRLEDEHFADVALAADDISGRVRVSMDEEALLLMVELATPSGHCECL